MVERHAPYQIPLAIVGMACRLPGAENLDQYWRLLIEGRSAVVELPPDRLDQETYFDHQVGARGKSYTKLGAIISSRQFDRARCPISEELARSVDNVHLLMCDVAAEALRNAGLDPFQLPIRNTGVYIGHAQGSSLAGQYVYGSGVEEAAQFLREVPLVRQLPAEEQEALIAELAARVRAGVARPTAEMPNVAVSQVAGTISKAFGLNGPYVAINSACASSLQSLLLGARALQLGHVDMAIVGGASDCKAETLVLFSSARAMSATGTRPFDADADGLVCGEGYGAVVLKTLDRALADGDRIWAVVRGLGVSSDGKGKSLWAPRKEGQLKAMERAYRGGLEMSELEYLEAHATATKLGDATELNTLTEILAQHFPPGKRIPITSVKANIGHTLETAGIAGIIKTVLAMHHEAVPPAINIRRLNPNIDWDKAPVYVPTTSVPWPKRADGKPRRAGVNAFGIGGLNMHVVLDEFVESSRALASKSSVPSRPPAEDVPIAVIGLGCVLPGAANPDAFWQLLASGRDPMVRVPADRWRPEISLNGDTQSLNLANAIGGFVTDFQYDWKRHKVPPKQVAQADPLQFMLLEAADQAIADAGYHQRPFNRENTGVVVGTEFAGDFASQLEFGLRLPELEIHVEQALARRGFQPTQARQAGSEFSESLLAHWPAILDETGSFSTSSLASRIGKTWNLMGGAAAIDAGQASGMAALSISADMLASGDCDLMLCAAGQRHLGRIVYECLALGGMLAQGAPRSPLDARAQGFWPGEGVVVLLLKRLADAEADGDRVHAVLRGLGAAHDGSSWGGALELAMQRSFGSAAGPSDVAIMELDALGGPIATADQLRAVSNIHGASNRQRPLLLSSVIGQIGNTLGASSLVSLLKAILELNHGELPATVGLNTPSAAVTGRPNLLRIPATRTPIDGANADGRLLATVGTCSNGLAYHAVLEHPQRVSVQSSMPDSQAMPAAAVAPAVASVKPASSELAATAGVDVAELEKFLINFVVEQTGYPPEVVELDVDLEADLGIDSIKKAQMFGELQQYFDVTPTDNLTLDDFPTLRHVVTFLAAAPQNAAATTAAAQPAPAGVAQTVAPKPTASAAQGQSATIAASYQSCRFGAANPASLRRVIEAALHDPQVWTSSTRRQFAASDLWRVAIVADGPTTLSARLATAIKQLDNPAAQTVLEQQGIFHRQARPETRIVFLFPGQGSQYTGMLRQVVDEVPAARVERQAIDDVMARLGYPTWAQLAWEPSSPLGKDVWTTQISMLLGDALLSAALAERGIIPDLVAGHSYGEYAALLAAHVWDLEQAVRVTRLRCDAIAASPTAQGTMLATTATPEVIEQLASSIEPTVYVANYNAPDQTVVGGSAAALAELERMLQASLFETRMLNVPCPFHTPLMRDAAELFRQYLSRETFHAPQIETYSVATNDVIRGPGEIGSNLVAHLTTPVRYAELVRKLAGQAPSVFVEVGPQQALTRLNRRILAAHEFAGIASDNPARPGVEQLVRVQALLECSGALDRQRPPLAKAPTAKGPGTMRRGQVWHFDATARRREKMRQTAAGESKPAAPRPAPVAAATTAPASTFAAKPAPFSAAVPAPAPVVSRAAAPVSRSASAVASVEPPISEAAAKAGVDVAELEKFLINFVVEQTGYPSEVVELDVDLEADLGIDSIKKAQMFGELQQYFDVTPTDNLTLDDFPTLRHVVNFLAAAPQNAAAMTAAPQPATAPAPREDKQVPDATRAVGIGAAGVTAAVTTDGGSAQVDVLRLSGTPYEMGHRHGLEKKTEIRRVLQRIADLTDGDWGELPIPRGSLSNPEAYFSPLQLDELRGMADAVEVPLGNLAALNLAVQNDLAANSAQVAIVCHHSRRRGVLHALAAELSLPPAVTEVLVPVVEVRQPPEGHACATVTFAGIVGSLVGLNSHGLAASIGAIESASATNDGALDGAMLSVDEVLQRGDTIAGTEVLLRGEGLPGAWTACLSHQGEQRLWAAEHDGITFALLAADNPLIATNHSVRPATLSPAPPASVERFDRLRERLAAPHAPRDAGALLTALGEMPSGGTLRLVAVVDPAQGDLLLQSDAVRERIPLAAFLTVPAVSDRPIAPLVAAPRLESDDPLRDLSVDGQSMRFSVRMVSAPWATQPPDFPQWKGAAAIHGNNPLADALHRRLAAGGASVVRLNESSSPEQAVAEFERAYQRQPIMHLFLTSHRDAQTLDRADPADWDALVQRRLILPYLVSQKMLQLAGNLRGLADCSLVAAVDLGGDFGFSGRVESPESGFMTGLVKALFLEYAIVREQQGFRAKAVDAPRAEDADSLAANICRELACRTTDYEVAFVDGQRYLQTALRAPPTLQETCDVRPGGTWVLTGGARGITAACGLALGRRFGLNLHLIGTTALRELDSAWRDLDEAGLAELRARTVLSARAAGQKLDEAWAKVAKAIEIDRNLRAFVEAGVRCTYHACDVADRASLQRVLDGIRATDGPIEGILHGAGIERAARFEKKTLDGLLATIGSKVTGAYNLMTLTRDDPVRHFIGFGSTSGRLGGNGQADYAAASDMLCKLVGWHGMRQPRCRAIGFHWHAWDEVGMASRWETVAMLKTRNVSLMPKDVGIRHLLRELYTQPGETELVFTDWEFHQRFYARDDNKTAPADSVQPAHSPRPAADRRVANRVLLRTIDAPLSEADATRPLPRAVFLWGQNADADALSGELARRGVAVHRLPPLDDPQAACAALEQAWRRSPARCLMLLGSRDEGAERLNDRKSVEGRIERGVFLPFWLARRWFELVNEVPFAEPATLVAVTSLGGDFGFASRVPAPEGGAMAGMLKSIFVEDDRFGHSRFRVKVIDAPRDEPPAQLAEAVCRELASQQGEVEVSWPRGRRQVVATRREPVDELPVVEVPRGGVWLATGGARGITAASALELARRYGLKMHLLGKSPAPDAKAPWHAYSEEQLKTLKSAIVREATANGRSPNEAWDRVRKDREIQQSLDKFRAAGVAVSYHSCDVADWDALAQVLDRIRRDDGPIEGILHGAGYAKPFRFATAPAESVRRTLAPKVAGTLALMHLTAKDPLRYFVAFGSLSGRFGGNGASDYAAGNEMLAKLCGWYRQWRPECRATCLHWQTWDEIGMVLMSEATGINKNTFKMAFIPPNEGVHHLLDELSTGACENEVLISDGFFERKYYPYAIPYADEPRAERPPAVQLDALPLVEKIENVADGSTVEALVCFDPSADPFLLDHKLRGKPFLPAVVGLEALVEAAAVHGGKPAVAVRNIELLEGWSFHTDRRVEARVRLTNRENGSVACELVSDFRNQADKLIKKDRAYLRASVELDARRPALDVPMGQPPSRWYPFTFPEDQAIYHGPVFRGVRAVAFDAPGGWGQLTALPLSRLGGARTGRDWMIPATLLDAGFYVCGIHSWVHVQPVPALPLSIELVRLGRMPRDNESCLVAFTRREIQTSHAVYDFTIFGEDPGTIIDVTGYRIVLVK